jgi:glutamine cyclotransferase
MSRGFASVLIAALIIGGAIAMLLNLTGTPTLEPAVPLSPDPAPLREYEVVAEYPHDPQALTQGLVYTGGFLYESIGGGVNLQSGKWNSKPAVSSSSTPSTAASSAKA